VGRLKTFTQTPQFSTTLNHIFLLPERSCEYGLVAMCCTRQYLIYAIIISLLAVKRICTDASHISNLSVKKRQILLDSPFLSFFIRTFVLPPHSLQLCWFFYHSNPCSICICAATTAGVLFFNYLLPLTFLQRL